MNQKINCLSDVTAEGSIRELNAGLQCTVYGDLRTANFSFDIVVTAVREPRAFCWLEALSIALLAGFTFRH